MHKKFSFIFDIPFSTFVYSSISNCFLKSYRSNINIFNDDITLFATKHIIPSTFVNSNSLQTETNKEVVDGEVTTIIKKRGAISPEELNAMREASEQNTDDINTAKNELDNYANEVKQNTPSTEQLVEHKSSTSLKIDLNDLSSPEKIEAA